MIYGSVCSGIEAASAAWHPLGWRAAFLSEIEAFPRAVLAHHYPSTPLHGDFTTIEADQYEPIDLLVGGTPCQDFSVAGLRAGMAGDRGNLTLQFLTLARRLRPRWMVWENVPGVLSSNGGRDFGAFLGGLGELGYGWAYRTLDAQYFGVAQRRRRVFVVGYLGDWRRAAAVLFERHSLSGDSTPRREKGEGTPVSPSLRARANSSHRADSQAFIPDVSRSLINCADVAPTLNAHFGDKQGLEDQHIRGGADCSFPTLAMCLNAGAMGRQDAESETLIPTIGCGFDVAHTLKGEGFDAGEDGTGRGTPLVPVWTTEAVAWQEAQTGCREYAEAGTLRANGPGHDPVGTRLRIGSAVRRLTPRECERLQGFPDDHTLIPWRKGFAPDGPRYKALGNSMAVPVMAYIGARIAAVNALDQRAAA